MSLLATEFIALASYSSEAIKKSLGPLASSGTATTPQNASPEALHELDLLLPKTCEALVLVSQCLITLLLHLEENITTTNMNKEFRGDLLDCRGSDGHGILENLLGISSRHALVLECLTLK
jgi:ataxin-10